MSASRRALTADQVHIWQFRLDQSLNAGDTLLSPDEQARAARLKIPEVRTRFIAGRVRLRQILSEYTDTSPPDLRFRYHPDAKPELDLAGIHPPLHFNLTHSGDNALLVLARQPVGVDLEQLRPLTGLDYIMKTALTPDERAQVESLSEDRKIFTFFIFWVGKEAVMKAVGGGFKLAARISLSLIEEEGLTLRSLPDDEPENWSLRRIPAPSGTVAALAVRLKNPELTLFYPDENQGSIA